jgi:hypothetical protein
MEASDSSDVSAAPWATGDEPKQQQSPADAHTAATEADAFAERPEVFVGAAFAGGLALAVGLRWLGSR